MFDDVFGMAILCAENFREAAHDSFGLSISTEVLEPILKEIDSLRIFNEEFQRQALNLDIADVQAQAAQGSVVEAHHLLLRLIADTGTGASRPTQPSSAASSALATVLEQFRCVRLYVAL